MNARKEGKGLGRSGLTRNKLFGALGHVHNPFSINSHRGHDAGDYRQEESKGESRTMNLQVETAKAEAILMAQNFFARFRAL